MSEKTCDPMFFAGTSWMKKQIMDCLIEKHEGARNDQRTTNIQLWTIENIICSINKIPLGPV